MQLDSEASLLESQIPTIVTLIKNCKSAQVVRDIQEVPAGCGSTVLTSSVTIHLLVKVRRSVWICLAHSLLMLVLGLGGPRCRDCQMREKA